MKACILCQTIGGLSKEHYIPSWMTRATGREDEPLKLVSQSGDVVGKDEPRGTAMTAHTRILCASCNGKLGSTLESEAERLLKDIVAVRPPKGIGKYLSGLTLIERQTLTWWAILHAIEFDLASYDSSPRITPSTSSKLLVSIGQLANNGPMLPPPDCAHFMVGKARRSGWSFNISRRIFDAAMIGPGNRPTSGEFEGSFLFGFQANEILGLLALIPAGAKLFKAQGWGHSIFPQVPGPQPLPLYSDLFGMWNDSFIDSRLD